ncbi:MAG TPA: ROK family transcriptional regulator [Acidobacteriaceae bacterium]|nr:ROK family transcriptional regulator [Acidobacteriaceae bacterium]
MIRGLQKVDLAYVRLASSEIARDINRDIVLEIVRAHQPISRAELSRVSGLQPSTVSEIVNQLIEERWVREGAMARLPRGRRPTMVGLNDNLVMLVADVRPKVATIAVVDLNGRLLSRAQLPVTSDPKKTIAGIVDSMLRMKESHSGRSFEGVGIALPGRVDSATQRLCFAPNLGWTGFDIKGAIEKGTGMPVEMENAANACLLAETWFGRMDGVRNAVLVTISEGLGTAILSNGQIHYGDHNMAGELGHVAMDPNGPKCGCGSRGCWEVFASSNAALRYYAESKPKRPARTIDDLMRLADEGDTAAIAALTRQAQWVGKGLRMIAASLAPELILIAGDIVGAWPRLAPVIEQSFAESTLANVRPRIMATHEADVARLRGAAILVVQRKSSAAETAKTQRAPRPASARAKRPAK